MPDVFTVFLTKDDGDDDVMSQRLWKVRNRKAPHLIMSRAENTVDALSFPFNKLPTA